MHKSRIRNLCSRFGLEFIFLILFLYSNCRQNRTHPVTHATQGFTREHFPLYIPYLAWRKKSSKPPKL